MYREILEKLINKKDLTDQEMQGIMGELMGGKLSEFQIAAFLIALRMKGESIVEIAAAAKVMRQFATSVEIEGFTLDTCGTGGDGLHTFNISTVSAIILAAADVQVLKHGNRSVSSKCGSADLLEALGVEIIMSPKQVKSSVDAHNFAFMFAPAFHKSMGNVAPARRSLGVRTIFNILGPLSNPAAASGQVLGVFDKDLLKTMAQVLNDLGTVKALIVHGRDGMDEIALTDVTDAVLLENGQLTEMTIDPRKYGMNLCKPEDLSGGDSKRNAEIAISILKGEVGPKRNIVLLNVAAGLLVASKVKSFEEGLKLAGQIIDSGKALALLESMITGGETRDVS